MIIRKCAGCQAEMDPDAIFCNECGLAQPAAVLAAVDPSRATNPEFTSRSCPRCSKQIVGDVKFCPDCAFDFLGKMSAAGSELSCPNCHRPATASDRFCRHCAYDLHTVAKLSSAMFCTACGKPFERTDKFCRHCAADLSGSDHTVAVPIVRSAAFPPPGPRVSSPTFVVPPTQTLVNTPDGTTQVPQGPHWISPSAAAFVVLCFFMPWIEWSCFGATKTISGVDLANNDGSFFLFPIAALTTLITYFVFKSQKKLWKARPWILISSGVGLFLLIYKVLSIPSSPQFMGQSISASDLGFKPHIGGFGTAIGYIVAMVGCSFMGKTVSAGSDSLPGWYVSPVGPNDDGQSWIKKRIVLLRPNKAAMLCYLTPLLGPVVVYIVFTIVGIMLMAISGSGSLFAFTALITILLCLSVYFVPQTIFLKNMPHKGDLLVRFHAFQSLFLIAALWGTILVVIGMMFATAGQSTPFNQSSSFIQFLSVVNWGVSITYLVLMIMLSVKANKGEMHKLPVLGDWAMDYARGKGDGDGSMKIG